MYKKSVKSIYADFCYWLKFIKNYKVKKGDHWRGCETHQRKPCKRNEL